VTARRRLLPIIAALALTAASPALGAFAVDGNVVELRSDEGPRYRISFLEPDLFRLQATLGSAFADEGSGKAPIVLAIDHGNPRVAVTDHDGYRAVSTTALELRIHASPPRLELIAKDDGRTLWRELKPLELSDSTCTQTLSSRPDERFFGGGQQNGRFEFKGELMEISYSGGWEEGDRPSPAPFYMSDRGYGVLRNTWADGSYDFRSARYLTATHAEGRLDAYVMVGPSIREVLGHYTRLTGRARLLPRWALGYGDADCYNDGDNVKKPGTVPEGWSDGPTGTTPDVVATLAEKYREHDMPGGWILPNDGYGCGYENLPEVVAGLGELGFRTGLWTENGVEKIAWEVGTAGTRVQKLDVAWTGKGYQWAMDANHDAAAGFLDNSDARPFIWTVMGWAGIQRYAVTWTGDQSGSWDFIRWHVPTLIGSGLSGMNYSTGDVDGIFGGSPDTFTRDLQWKCFTPVLMGMSGWSQKVRKHPWWFDEPHRSINRRYLKLRQRLMPYLYTLARETETTGAPMVRGIFWDHPDDPHAHDHPYQFILGRDLLVAPVYRSQAASGGWREDVYLPEGRWIDYWNGREFEAGPDGRLLDLPVDLATIPVFARAGAIIPMYPESLHEGEKPADPLTLDLYPYGADSEFVLYEDDGDTRAYREGAYSRQGFAMHVVGETIVVGIGAVIGEFEGVLERREIELLVHLTAAPLSVAIDGEPVEGWSFDAGDRRGLLRVSTGSLDMRESHHVVLRLDPAASTAHLREDDLPAKPAGDGTVPVDALRVVGRAAEEPGHPLENAFDGDPDTWFRTVRDQAAAYGPHEFTLSLGERRVVEGFRIAPRNDKWWEWGQVRDYELYLADVNGRWGTPVTGTLERSEEMQEIRFPARAGRLLRFRVLTTHDNTDPPAQGGPDPAGGPYHATRAVRVGATTISEFRLIERPAPLGSPRLESLAPVRGDGVTAVMNGLRFEGAMTTRGASRIDFALDGDWRELRTEVGILDGSVRGEGLRFQVWGDGRLLWDSGRIASPDIAKPRLDLRGVRALSLRTVAGDPEVAGCWAETVLVGHEGDVVTAVEAR